MPLTFAPRHLPFFLFPKPRRKFWRPEDVKIRNEDNAGSVAEIAAVAADQAFSGTAAGPHHQPPHRSAKEIAAEVKRIGKNPPGIDPRQMRH
jgi:hypothetical protein